LGQSTLVVFCASSTLLLTSVVRPTTSQWATPLEVTPFSYWSIKTWFLTEGKLVDVFITPSSWGSPTACTHTSSTRHQRWGRFFIPFGVNLTILHHFILIPEFRWGEGYFEITAGHFLIGGMLTSSDSDLSPLVNWCELALSVLPLLHPKYHPNQSWGGQENLHSSGSERKARSIKKGANEKF
jgi:hypothetical protein